MKGATVLLLLVAFLLVGVLPVHANPYVGSYLSNSQSTSTSNFFGTSFTSTSASVIPSGDWIASEMGNAGTATTGSCPCFYQLGYIIDDTGNVAVTAQYWGPSGSLYSSQTNNVGSASSITLEGITEYVSGSGIQSKAFVYNTLTQYNNNSPNSYTFTAQSTGDTQFYYGTSTGCSSTLLGYQVGVESPTTVSSSSWYVWQNTMEVYTTSWIYQAGSSIEGNNSFFQCISGSAHDIGGAQMSGVSAVYTAANTVEWQYSGTTEGNNVALWSGSGGSTPYACQVSGRC